MSPRTKRAVGEGIGIGLIAGVVFAMMEVAGAALMGNPPATPIRMFASVVAGQSAMETMPLGSALALGLAAHFVLSAAFGLVYALLSSRTPDRVRTTFARQALLGTAYGAALWLVNFQIIARIAYPWFLDAPQFLQLMMHALFFGLPLGLVYAATQRRAEIRTHAPSPA